jgi:hypothetical protein
MEIKYLYQHYPNWYFLFENMPSGNPDDDSVFISKRDKQSIASVPGFIFFTHLQQRVQFQSHLAGLHPGHDKTTNCTQTTNRL